MSPNVKLLPNLDQESTKTLNLTVLQRIDPFIEEILITAAHVTFYEFNIDRSEWSRKDVEGSLFVVKRNTQPRFQFIVMNRRNTDNLVENLLGDFEYELQIPYLLYRNAAQEVNGIWFYNTRDCEDVANLFTRIINAYSKVSPKAKVSPAKNEFDELEAVPTSATVMETPLEPSSSTTPSTMTNVPDDISFRNYFNAATSIGQSQGPIPPLSTWTPNLLSAPTPTMQPPPTLPSSSTPSAPLVRPSVFLKPSTLMMPLPTAPPPMTPLHRPYGAPLLQPFPPPSPSPSLVVTRDQVREALTRLVQNPVFVDMVYEELVKGI